MGNFFHLVLTILGDFDDISWTCQMSCHVSSNFTGQDIEWSQIRKLFGMLFARHMRSVSIYSCCGFCHCYQCYCKFNTIDTSHCSQFHNINQLWSEQEQQKLNNHSKFWYIKMTGSGFFVYLLGNLVGLREKVEKKRHLCLLQRFTIILLDLGSSTLGDKLIVFQLFEK